MAKAITTREQKDIMLEMLKFVDEICRENGIKYSLIGGSLIGAVRHRGYIPWDDDIDIVLTLDNYNKLVEILSRKMGRYRVLKGENKSGVISFTKLIDTRTQIEECNKYFDPNYGVFLDIFCYYPAPNNNWQRLRQYLKLKMLYRISIPGKISIMTERFPKTIKMLLKNMAFGLVGGSRIAGLFKKISLRYAKEDTGYVMNSWLVYGFEQEVQRRENVEEYIDAEFEGMKVMIFKNYDEILRTTFGDYMQLPPEEERVPRHNMKMWWKEGHDNEEEK